MRSLPVAIILLSAGTIPWSSGCEQQDSPVRAADAPREASSPESEGGVSTPGTSGYYNALSGARGVAENTKQKADDYNKKLEDQMDDLFND